MKTGFSTFVALGSWIAAAMLSGGCQVTGRQTYKISVSADTMSSLQDIAERLRTAGAELDFKCSKSSGFFGSGAPECEVIVDGNREPKIDAEVLPRPFDHRPLVLRIHGGTEAAQGALYDALGALGASTNDFQGSLDERKLALEDKKIKFRCVASRDAVPAHECWTLVAADLLK